jgi:hypothetical protein
MKGKRRRHDPEFKARVALEALKGIKTISGVSNLWGQSPQLHKVCLMIRLIRVVLGHGKTTTFPMIQS